MKSLTHFTNKTIDQFRLETTPRMSKMKMAKRMGMAYNSYLKHADDPDTYIYWKLAAWCIKHNIDNL